MLVLLAVCCSVTFERMNIGYTGVVLAGQQVLAIRSSWYGVSVIWNACYARTMVNSGGEIMLREIRPLRLIK